jgi:urea transport system permease protein
MRLIVVICAILLVFSTLASAAEPPVSNELVDAIKHLKDIKRPDTAGRQAVYDLLSVKGDARLIPAMKAYENGQLQLSSEHLTIYGDRVDVQGKGSVLPVIDAISGQAITGPDGQPLYASKPDLSNAIRTPPRSERQTINDLISTLSLLDPDPAARLQSIRDTGERAAKAFVDQPVQQRVADTLKKCRDALTGNESAARAIAAIDAALAQRKTSLLATIPDSESLSRVAQLLAPQKIPAAQAQITDALNSIRDFQDYLDAQKTTLDELPRYSAALHRQLQSASSGKIHSALIEATAEMDLVLGDRSTQLQAINTLGSLGTSRADNLLRKFVDAARTYGDSELTQTASVALHRADRYQMVVQFLQSSFQGLSTGSILILLALGLSIIFGLMGVINMAQGEFMMVGAFTTFVISNWFQAHMPGSYDYYPIVAVPAAFIVSAFVGYLCEVVIVRHLYGRPLETLLATWGISLILIQTARSIFSDNLSIKSPSWMQGGVEIITDLVFPLDRVYIIFYCTLCIGVVYFLVNRTKLGLLLRATTQNRQMASALGVGTRRVDAMTFALGAGLAGLAGVVVPLYNKINPSVGQEYIVDCFMVVVVGGVGKLSGAIIAGLALGFLNKYLEPVLSSYKSIESGSSVYAKVIVLGLVVLFLQWRPAGLFPPKGRVADA